MTYLIIGASGFIGRVLYDYCRQKDLEVYGTYHKGIGEREWVHFDQTTESFEDLNDRLEIGSAENLCVILCAANSSIDSCKKNEGQSRLLNVTSTEKLIDEVIHIGAKPVFLSSEAVFDGENGMYDEDDVVCPITVYGHQKVEVERYLEERYKGDHYLIFRISRAVSAVPGKGDIFDEFHKKIINGEEILCLKGQRFNPTDVTNVAGCIVRACEAGLTGLFHIANKDYITRAQLAELYAGRVLGTKARILDKEYKEMSFFDNRHINGGLNSNRIESAIDYKMTSLDIILKKRAENERSVVFGEEHM